MAQAGPSNHSLKPDEDLPLVDRVLAGDPRAFEELVRRHERRVFRTTLAVTGNTEDAEEAMQDTFLKVHGHLGEFQRASRFTTWLTRIAVNESLQILRRRHRTDSLDEPAERDEEMLPRQFQDWQDNPEKIYAKQELRQMVEDAIQSLHPIYREAFVLRDVQGLTTEEAAQALELNTAALKSRLLRARLMMREAMAARLALPATLTSRMAHAGQMMQMGMRMGAQMMFRGKGGVVMLKCKEVLAELSNYLDGEVTPELRRSLENHLAMCHRCTLIFDTTQRTLRIVSDAGPFEVPLEVSARLYTRLQGLMPGG